MEESAGDLLMFDSVTVSALPAGGAAYAGYVDGDYPTWTELSARFPSARLVSIATRPTSRALILDVETGDAGVNDVAGFIRAGHDRALWAPGFYASLSRVPDVIAALEREGIARDRYRLWTAHWTGVPHLCSHLCDPRLDTVAGATQFEGPNPSRNFDTSRVQRKFLPMVGQTLL